MENCDGTLSIFGTMLDHDAPVEAPPAGPAAGFSAAQLAAVGRVLSYNDPQVDVASSAGEPTDRNVELLLDDPRATRPARPEAAPAREAAAGPGRRAAMRLRFRVRSDGEAREGRRRALQGQAQADEREGRRADAGCGCGKARRRARVKKTIGCTKRRASVRVRLR